VKKRYYVEPIDNLGSLQPAPPRDRTWAVCDRSTGQQCSEHDRRDDARVEAHQLNMHIEES
jgi:hypothetical protein